MPCIRKGTLPLDTYNTNIYASTESLSLTRYCAFLDARPLFPSPLCVPRCRLVVFWALSCRVVQSCACLYTRTSPLSSSHHARRAKQNGETRAERRVGDAREERWGGGMRSRHEIERDVSCLSLLLCSPLLQLSSCLSISQVTDSWCVSRRVDWPGALSLSLSSSLSLSLCLCLSLPSSLSLTIGLYLSVALALAFSVTFSQCCLHQLPHTLPVCVALSSSICSCCVYIYTGCYYTYI